MDNDTLFERLPEPYLVLDGRLAPVAANAAWRLRFGDRQTARPAADGRNVELPAVHRELIGSVSRALSAGSTRSSSVVRLDTRTNADSDESGQRDWQVVASFAPATSGHEALVTLRYDDLTADLPAGAARHSTHTGIHHEPALGLAGIGAWRIDVAKDCIECSARCLQDLGVDPASCVTVAQMLGGSPVEIAANWSELKQGRPIERELRLVSSDTHRWVLVRGVGQFGADHALRAVVGFTLDITSRKTHELHLHALADEERSGREHSDALARTTDQFIASVSHELRSPLNAIVSWAELLKVAAHPSHVERAGEAIRRNGRQLSHMVDDLLDSGAIASGKLSVALQPVDLGAIVAIVAEDVNKLAQHKNLTLDAADIAPCVVMADESRMMQIAWNLLTNAIKFTEAGQVVVSVRPVNGRAELVVRDTGLGIEPDALPLIFDRFQQVAPRSSGRVSGLGLGLWLTRQIVSLHQGTIQVASPGRGFGATFTVTLPLAVPYDG